MRKTIGFIGGGNMGEAIIKGIGINNAICLLILFKRYQVENIVATKLRLK